MKPPSRRKLSRGSRGAMLAASGFSALFLTSCATGWFHGGSGADSPRPPVQRQPAPPPDALLLAQRSSDGRFLVTSDGTAWQTGSGGQHAAATWNQGVAVSVVPGQGTTSHPYLLVNHQSRQAVPAKRGRNLY